MNDAGLVHAKLDLASLEFPDDTPDVRFWKGKMRASMVRESLLLAGLAVTTIGLLAIGWRPIWP